jgi:hypothetical protein
MTGAGSAIWILAGLLWSAPRAVPVEPPPVKPTVEVLEDGLELIVAEQPGADRASLRWVVRAGAARDPRGRSGLAHMVEHLLFYGSYDVNGRSFQEEARRAGAQLNAHTTYESTKYELDAPASAFLPLARRFMQMLSSPAWDRTNLVRERGVVDTENAYYDGGAGLMALVDDALFPAPTQGGPLIGTSASRSAILSTDVIRFFEEHYTARNSTLVFTGAVSAADARTLAQATFRIPPALPEERARPLADAPSLPSEQKIPAYVTATVFGYGLDGADAASCPAVAALVELRLKMAVQLAGPMLPAIDVGCQRLRGSPFVLAFAYSRQLDSGDLPAVLRGVFRSLERQPPSASERKLVDARQRSLLGQVQSKSDKLAEAIAYQAAQPHPTGRTDLTPLAPAPLPSAAALTQVVRRSFVPDRRVLLHLSPLQD